MPELNKGQIWKNVSDSGRTLRIHAEPDPADPDHVKVVILTASGGRPMRDAPYEETHYLFDSDDSYSPKSVRIEPFRPLILSLQELLAEWRPRHG